MTDPGSAAPSPPNTSLVPATEPAREARAYCWVPTMSLEPGMVIARPVMFGQGINSIIHLPAGTELKANTIAQLVNKGVECVAVAHAPLETEALNTLWAAYSTRLHEIFGPCPAEPCRLLMEALLEDGPCQC